MAASRTRYTGPSTPRSSVKTVVSSRRAIAVVSTAASCASVHVSAVGELSKTTAAMNWWTSADGYPDQTATALAQAATSSLRALAAGASIPRAAPPLPESDAFSDARRCAAWSPLPHAVASRQASSTQHERTAASYHPLRLLVPVHASTERPSWAIRSGPLRDRCCFLGRCTRS